MVQEAIRTKDRGRGHRGRSPRRAQLVFCEGKLIAYPARSLNKPFFFVTSRLVLERLQRDLRAFGFADLALKAHVPGGAAKDDNRSAWVAEPALAGKPLVVEDLVYEGSGREDIPRGGERWASSLPGGCPGGGGDQAPEAGDPPGRAAGRRLPVAGSAGDARAGAHRAHRGQDHGQVVPTRGPRQSGNLWYEEALPADCLFASFVTERVPAPGSNPRGRRGPDGSRGWEASGRNGGASPSVQIGGNETVGYGRCWWHGVSAGEAR